MSDPDRFVAQILEASAAGFAGLSASALLERHPEIGTRYEPEGFAGWKAQFQRWVLDLSAAVDAGEPALFEARMRWTRKAFLARQVPVEDLRAALEALRDVLRERLPDGAEHSVVPTVDRALDALADPAKEATGGALDPTRPADRLALDYLKTVLEGNPRDAIDGLLRAVDAGLSPRDAYLDVLIPAQSEVGRLWLAGELSIAEEHVITATTRRVMALLCQRARIAARIDKSVVLACVEGNVHDLGLRAIADFFEMAGWRAVSLGPDVPSDEIARSVQYFDADLAVLSAVLDPHVKAVQRAIERIRAIEDRRVPVLVGGPVFDQVQDLWRKVGADGYAARIDEVEPLGRRLTAS